MSFIGDAIGSITGSKQAAKAADNASQAQIESAREANALQERMYNQSRADMEPWRTTGAAGLNALAGRLGVNGGSGDLMRSFSAKDFQQDPGYAFRQVEGMNGINNSAAARGGVLSGAALKAASRYNQDFASNEYSNAYNRFNTNQTNQYNRLASIAGVGQQAAQTAGQQALATGQTMGENITGAGNARASGYMAAGQQQGNTFNSLLGMGVGAAGLGWKPFK